MFVYRKKEDIMTNVKIATVNPTKIKAVEEVFAQYFGEVNIQSFEVESGVPSQPVGDEVKEGAENRIKYAKEHFPDETGDYWVGVEGGIISVGEVWFNVQIVCIEDSNGRKSFGMSQGFPVPNSLVEEVKETSIAKTMDRIFDKRGGVSFITKGLENRCHLVKEGVIMALTGINNEKDGWYYDM